MSDEISITGTKHLDQIECSTLVINGVATIDHDVQANQITITGSAIVQGSVDTKSLTVSGSLRVFNDLQAEEAIISGHLYTEGNTSINRLVASGIVNLSNFCSERVEGGEGVFIEDLSADHFQLGDGDSRPNRETS